ncbi:TerC/Alx family metal homeostasis membrane protein [Aliivibrio fischeri]|uniref:TerC/Alx family metal homeostasis membrane protein n=1 Tax=Aliivibrio fischeri TaxID=668 RepID=UPI001F309A22|nr:TerC/Alx family metal homeostasis membrane protein [Aliivibrio fischeri]MCE7568125.1 TerC/Alx family metal homeostasis membrane protein [Aliivibrio fischeri]
MSPLTWELFGFVVLAMFALDLFQTRKDTPSLKKALVWSLFWFALAFVFCAVIYLYWPLMAPESSYTRTDASVAFLTGYLLEKMLSVDNLFVFALIFSQFAVPESSRPRILLWGIIGALALRAVMIFVGAELLAQYHWILYIFAVFLIITGVKLWFADTEENSDFASSKLVMFFKKHIPFDDKYHGNQLFAKVSGKTIATPLLLVVIVIMFTDIMFALDSIPAIFAITQEPFLVFAANVFALLGLRSLYFVLQGMLDKFCYLQPALAFILSFIGIKMFLVGTKYEVPTVISLLTIVAIITLAIIGSVYKNRSQQQEVQD